LFDYCLAQLGPARVAASRELEPVPVEVPTSECAVGGQQAAVEIEQRHAGHCPGPIKNARTLTGWQQCGQIVHRARFIRYFALRGIDRANDS